MLIGLVRSTVQELRPHWLTRVLGAIKYLFASTTIERMNHSSFCCPLLSMAKNQFASPTTLPLEDPKKKGCWLALCDKSESAPNEGGNKKRPSMIYMGLLKSWVKRPSSSWRNSKSWTHTFKSWTRTRVHMRLLNLFQTNMQATASFAWNSFEQTTTIRKRPPFALWGILTRVVWKGQTS